MMVRKQHMMQSFLLPKAPVTCVNEESVKKDDAIH